MSALDVALAIAVLSAFVGGYRSGLIVRVTSWLGLGLGLALVATNLAAIRGAISTAKGMPEVLVFGLVLAAGALAGKSLGYFSGRWIRHHLPGRSLARLDRFAGAAVGIGGVALTFWMLRPLLALVPGWPSEITRDSFVADRFEQSLPKPPDVLRNARRSLSAGVFPQVTDLVSRSLAPGLPPTTATVDAATISAARRGVVRVHSRACGFTVSGTGYVSDRGEVTTAAHVVSGSRSIMITDDDGRVRSATIVSIDPSLDRARLSVDTGGLIVLPAGKASPGDEVAIFGFPKGGGLRVASGGVQEKVVARGRDITDRRDVERPVLVIAATLAPGDSGGPVLDNDGAVVAMAIAVAPDRNNTAYAIDPSGPVITEATPPGRCLAG
jgi:S1-C subfamily serine protease